MGASTQNLKSLPRMKVPLCDSIGSSFLVPPAESRICESGY